MKFAQVFLIVLCVAVLAGCGGAPSETQAPVEVAVEEAPAVAEEVVEAKNNVVYVCNCGPDCDCNTVAVEPGTCTCGTELVGTHLVKVEENEGLLCTCGSDCDCELDTEDATKCSCGNDIRRVSFEGTGLYYCKCGGSCTCNHVSSEPGTCSCGMDLITS